MKDYVNEFLAFVEGSYTPYHAVKNLSDILEANGYMKLYDSASWNLSVGGKYYLTKNDSAIIAFQLPKDLSDLSFNMVASHTDSPCFKLKENSTLETAAKTVALNVEPYGGLIYSSWLDKPLSVAGRAIVNNNGVIETKLVNFDCDLCIIPNLAIHMNREINNGYKYNPAVDLQPLYGPKGTPTIKELVNKEFGIEALSCDLFLYNRSRGTKIGYNEEYFSAPQIDNLESAYATLLGFLEASNEKSINVYAAFDNEEVGSGTKQGALSTFLKDTLNRIRLSLGKSDEEFLQMISKSFMVSCDNAHAVHPNLPQSADSLNRPYMNSGIVIKGNANQSYTTDAVSLAVFTEILKKAEVPYQFFFNRSDIRGGSTLGHLSLEQISVDSIDIGLAQLSMHSSYETAGSKDICYLVSGIKAYFNTHLSKKNNNFTLN